MSGRFNANHPLHLVVGFSIWSLWFIAIYGGLSVLCSGAEPGQSMGISHPINIVLLIVTGACGVLLGALALWCWRNATQFPGKLSAFLYCAAMIATLAIAAPVFYLPPCQ